MAGGVRARGALAGFGRKHPDALQVRFSTKERRRCVLNAHAHEAIHQLSTEEEPTKAVDPPEPTPSMLSMGIPYFTLCIAAGPAVRPVRWHPTVDLLYHHRMRKSKPPSRDMLRTGHDAAFLLAEATDLPVPFRTGGFCRTGNSSDDDRAGSTGRYEFLVVRRALQLDESVQLRILLGNSPRFEASECADRVKRKITDDWTLERSSAARSR
jgi:hypothetical protein